MFVYAEVFLFGFFFVCHKFFGVVVVVIIIVVVVVVVVVVIVIIHHRYYNCIISIVPNRPLWTTWFETFVDYCLVAVFCCCQLFFLYYTMNISLVFITNGNLYKYKVSSSSSSSATDPKLERKRTRQKKNLRTFSMNNHFTFFFVCYNSRPIHNYLQFFFLCQKFFFVANCLLSYCNICVHEWMNEWKIILMDLELCLFFLFLFLSFRYCGDCLFHSLVTFFFLLNIRLWTTSLLVLLPLYFGEFQISFSLYILW